MNIYNTYFSIHSNDLPLTNLPTNDQSLNHLVQFPLERIALNTTQIQTNLTSNRENTRAATQKQIPQKPTGQPSPFNGENFNSVLKSSNNSNNNNNHTLFPFQVANSLGLAELETCNQLIIAFNRLIEKNLSAEYRAELFLRSGLANLKAYQVILQFSEISQTKAIEYEFYLKQAKEAFEKVRTICESQHINNGIHLKAFIEIGKLHISDNNLKSSEEVFTTIIQQYPRSAESYKYLGIFAANSGDYIQAEKHFNHARNIILELKSEEELYAIPVLFVLSGILAHLISNLELAKKNFNLACKWNDYIKIYPSRDGSSLPFSSSTYTQKSIEFEEFIFEKLIKLLPKQGNTILNKFFIAEDCVSLFFNWT